MWHLSIVTLRYLHTSCLLISIKLQSQLQFIRVHTTDFYFRLKRSTGSVRCRHTNYHHSMFDFHRSQCNKKAVLQHDDATGNFMYICTSAWGLITIKAVGSSNTHHSAESTMKHTLFMSYPTMTLGEHNNWGRQMHWMNQLCCLNTERQTCGLSLFNRYVRCFHFLTLRNCNCVMCVIQHYSSSNSI